MNTNGLSRRTLIVATACGLPWLTAHAQINTLSEAINKAGRQRMLSQRVGKAWLALVHGIEKTTAKMVFDNSIALFDRQLVELKAYANAANIQTTYTKLDVAWSSYKTALTVSGFARENAANMLQLNAGVLSLAHQGTQQFESVQDKPLGKLVNVAGRQRMLSQRMAMYYLAARLPIQSTVAAAEITKARTEFVSAMEFLRNAPETTPRIAQELALADGQWVFFDAALQRNDTAHANTTKPLTEVFTASENLLTVMDQVTGMYASMKT